MATTRLPLGAPDSRTPKVWVWPSATVTLDGTARIASVSSSRTATVTSIGRRPVAERRTGTDSSPVFASWTPVTVTTWGVT